MIMFKVFIVMISHQKGGGGEGGHCCEAGLVHGVGIIGLGHRVVGVVGVYVVRVGWNGHRVVGVHVVGREEDG